MTRQLFILKRFIVWQTQKHSALSFAIHLEKEVAGIYLVFITYLSFIYCLFTIYLLLKYLLFIFT